MQHMCKDKVAQQRETTVLTLEFSPDVFLLLMGRVDIVSKCSICCSRICTSTPIPPACRNHLECS